MPQWRARNAAASQAVLPGCRAISSQLRIFRPEEIDKLLPCFWQLFSCCASSEWGVFPFLTSLSPSITYITSVNLHLICLWVSWHLKTALKFSILFMQLSCLKKILSFMEFTYCKYLCYDICDKSKPRILPLDGGLYVCTGVWVFVCLLY